MTAYTLRLALIPHKVIKLQLIHSILIQIKCKLHLLLISSPVTITSILGYIPSEDLEHNHGESEPMSFSPYQLLLFILLLTYPFYNVRILKMKKLN